MKINSRRSTSLSGGREREKKKWGNVQRQQKSRLVLLLMIRNEKYKGFSKTIIPEGRDKRQTSF